MERQPMYRGYRHRDNKIYHAYVRLLRRPNFNDCPGCPFLLLAAINHLLLPSCSNRLLDVPEVHKANGELSVASYSHFPHQEAGYAWQEGDVEWTPKSTLLYPAICSVAGLVAGMFGVGGGIVKICP